MKKLLAVAAAFALMPVLSRAQGFTSTAISSNQVSAYQALITASSVGVVNTSGQSGFPGTSPGYDGASALSTAVTFTNGSGLTGLSVLILNGQFGSTGQSVSDTAAQSGPFTGIVVALYDPSQPVGSAAGFSNFSINGTAATGLPTTVSSAYSAYYYEFQSPTSQFFASGQLDTTLGSGSRVTIFAVQAVPEPTTTALFASAVGGFSLLGLFRKKT